MFPHDQAQRRQLADLPAFPPHDGRVRGQRLLAALAQHRPVLDHHVGRRHQPQRLAPMPQLPARPLAAPPPQALRLAGQAVARRGLAAVVAVRGQPRLQLLHARH
jgi:hypothetical protein